MAGVKLTTAEGFGVYFDIDQIACIFQGRYSVRVYVGGAEIDVRGDIDDLAELIWGDRKDMPERPSRRGLPEGTTVERSGREP